MRLRDFEAGVEAAQCGESLWELFAGYFRGTAVARVSYLHLPPLGAPDARHPKMRAEGFPEELVARYIHERHYRDNPVVSATRKQLEPVYWEDAAAAAGLSDRERAFVEVSVPGNSATASASRSTARTVATDSAASASSPGCGGFGRRCCTSSSGCASSRTCASAPS